MNDVTLIGCHRCHKLVRWREQSACPRCGAPLHLRTPRALSWTWAWLISASALMLPANLLPITRLQTFGVVNADTIFSGVMSLYDNDMPGIATIVLVASVIVPLFKILGLSWICLRLKVGGPLNQATAMRLYRFIEFIGRWSILDLFVIALMMSAIDRGLLLNVTPGPAATAFGGVVVLTLFAAKSLDTRLLWDRENDNESKEP